jgi:dipeptidyl aminopeptidase/acylaminoacyl peptidase
MLYRLSSAPQIRITEGLSRMAPTKLFAAAALTLTLSAQAQTSMTYQKPPAAIEELLDAPVTPVASLSPDRKLLLIQQPQTFPTIADVAQPRFRLAGLRFNPATNGPSRTFDAVGFSLQPISGGDAKPILGLPARLRATGTSWSPDGKHIAFVQRSHDALELWIIDVATAHAHRLDPAIRLNAVLGMPYTWMPDSSTLLCRIVPTNRGAAPKPSEVPTGPHVSESLGKVSPAPTYEDMLKTPDDEAIFAFYATSQLALVPLTGPAKLLPIKGLIDTADPSPDGRFVLLQQLHTPFSYTFPSDAFPLKTEVLTLKSGALTPLSDRPLVDYLPIANDAVAIGPRDYDWRSDAPATLTWIESADNGDPNAKVDIHDRLFSLSAPFDGQPTTLLESPMRLRGVNWGTDHLAIATEARWSDRHLVLLAFNPSTPGKPTMLYEGSSQERYKSPGSPVTVPNAAGFRVLQLTPDASAVYFISAGATPAGDQPFLATMPVTGGEQTILYRSADPYYAAPVALLGPDTALIRRESETESPNYFVASLRGRVAPVAITNFPSPYAGMKVPTKQLLKYKRADGVELTATLWIPAGYDKSQGPLPTLMEAYPAEFKSRSAAGQVSGSPNRFPRIGWGSPIFFTETGYAVLENAAIPIIGEGTAQPNDTYIEQLVAGAKAAIDYGASIGVVDPKRVAVMGHSYGAFMTANLLAHSNLFRAGIARSGAYNRTLTPFGFQAEERTYWQAPDTYFKMSPFNYADRIKTPILLIHGEADDNTGTYPIQSERFYAALKGQGATVRLVFLPLEAHGYEAHESLQHMLWEMNTWLDTYVKPTVSPIAKSGE